MAGLLDSPVFDRIYAVIPQYNHEKKKFHERKKQKRKYADVMKEVTEKSDKKNEDGHINVKI